MERKYFAIRRWPKKNATGNFGGKMSLGKMRRKTVCGKQDRTHTSKGPVGPYVKVATEKDVPSEGTYGTGGSQMV